MLCLATGLQMNVGIVARGSSDLSRGILLLLRKFLAAVVDLLTDQGALLNPSFVAAGSAYARETPFPLQDLHRFTILQ
jgi:hypothetical protein